MEIDASNFLDELEALISVSSWAEITEDKLIASSCFKKAKQIIEFLKNSSQENLPQEYVFSFLDRYYLLTESMMTNHLTRRVFSYIIRNVVLFSNAQQLVNLPESKINFDLDAN